MTHVFPQSDFFRTNDDLSVLMAVDFPQSGFFET